MALSFLSDANLQSPLAAPKWHRSLQEEYRQCMSAMLQTNYCSICSTCIVSHCKLLHYLCDVYLIYWPSTVYAGQVLQSSCVLEYEGLQQSLEMRLEPKAMLQKHAGDTAIQRATPMDLAYCHKKAAVLAGHDLVALKLQHLFPQDQCGYASTKVT